MRFPSPNCVGVIALVLWGVGVCASPAFGQQTPEPVANEAQAQQEVTSQPAPPEPPLNKGELQLQLKQVQESTSISEELKNQVVGLYTQAGQQLDIAEQWSAKAAEYQAERKSAPETLATIQAELAVPLGDPVPNVAAGANRADLEQNLRQAKIDLDAAKKALTDWERERDRRTTRRKEIPDLLTAAKTRLQTMVDAPPLPETEQVPAVRVAQQSLNQAKRLAAEREIEAYNSELLSYDARRDLLQARLDRATRRVTYLEKMAGGWEKLVQEMARKESEAALREAREHLKRAHPAILTLAEERAKRALEAKEIQATNKQVDADVAATDALLTEQHQEFEKITRRVNATGLTDVIGQFLRTQRGKLPNLRPFEHNLSQRKDHIVAVQLEIMKLEDRRSELMNTDAEVDKITAKIEPSASDEQRFMIRQAGEEAIIALRNDVDGLLKEYDRLFDKLVDLDSKERELVSTIERFTDYVDEKILWIKSGTLPNRLDITNGREALAWLLDPGSWQDVIRSIWVAIYADPGPAVTGLVFLLGMWFSGPRLGRLIREYGEAATKPSKDSMRHTLGTLAATIVLIMRWPFALWFAGWLISSPAVATDFSKALVGGLNEVAMILLTLQSLRQIARRGGLAECHFRWSRRSLTVLKRHVSWLTAVVVPCFFVVGVFEAQSWETASESLGRLAFIVGTLATTLFLQRVLLPSGQVMCPALQSHLDGWLHRLRHAWYVMMLLIPISLAIASVVGYCYTSHYLSNRFVQTSWFVLALIVTWFLIERWLLLQRRRRAIAEAKERAAQRQLEQEEGEATAADPDIVTVTEEKIDIAAVNKQTLQLTRLVLVVVGVVGMWGIWAEALPALGVLREVTLWTTTQQVSEATTAADGNLEMNQYTRSIPITLADLGLALLVSFATFVAVKNIPGLLEITVLQHLPIDAGGRFAVTTITRYLITVTGVVIVFSEIGIGWSKVQWLIAAMTVGLGFGLQEIFANLVSGLMLLFERPIRIGDTVTVADTSGTVTKIRVRATTIVGWDRKELIIPNKEFVTGNVVNWTLSDSILRLIIPVGIAYGSDTKTARDLMMRIAQDHPNVLEDPPPRALFMRFGASSLDFELRVYVGTIDHYLATVDEITNSIDNEFRKAGIEIAFPQQDVHIRSVPQSWPSPLDPTKRKNLPDG